MGSSGCPQRLQVAPSSPMAPTKFVSAMPSSMCWPVGRSRQCRIVSASSANQLRRSSCDQTPTLLTEPPGSVGQQPCRRPVTGKAGPRVGGVDTEAGGELVQLVLGQQGGVVLRVP